LAGFQVTTEELANLEVSLASIETDSNSQAEGRVSCLRELSG